MKKTTRKEFMHPIESKLIYLNGEVRIYTATILGRTQYFVWYGDNLIYCDDSEWHAKQIVEGEPRVERKRTTPRSKREKQYADQKQAAETNNA